MIQEKTQAAVALAGIYYHQLVIANRALEKRSRRVARMREKIAELQDLVNHQETYIARLELDLLPNNDNKKEGNGTSEVRAASPLS